MSAAHPHSPLAYSVWDRVKLAKPMVEGDTDGYDGLVPRSSHIAMEQANQRNWRRIEAWQATMDDLAGATQRGVVGAGAGSDDTGD